MHEEAHDVKPGKYRHFKGGLYEVIGTALHSETLEEMVLYRHLDDADTKLWVRPRTMFLGTVEREGRTCQRFTLIEKTPEGEQDTWK